MRIMHTSWCTACCTCRATTTNTLAQRVSWKPGKARYCSASVFEIPTPWRIDAWNALLLTPCAHLGTPWRASAMTEHPKRSLLERLSALLMREPEDRGELLNLLHAAYEKNLLDADALSMIEGVMQVSEMQVRDIMVPRAQMDLINIDDTPDRFIPHVIATAHSRFPVIARDRDDVIGVLLAKDLLRYYAGEEEFNVRDMLRPAVFVPESKRLNVLLREFRANRNHM